MQVGISQLIARDLPLNHFLEQAAQSDYEVVELSLQQHGDLTPQSTAMDLAKLLKPPPPIIYPLSR